MAGMWFAGWSPVVRTLLVGAAAYAALVLVLRVSGKRTLAKMNAFDLVVTVALGSTLASVLTSKDVSFVQGIAALGLLVGLQFVVAWSSVRSKRVRRLVRSEPALLLHRGELLHDALRRERVTRSEVEGTVRSRGIARLEDAFAVILESNGELSVIPAIVPGTRRDEPLLPPTDRSGEGS